MKDLNFKIYQQKSLRRNAIDVTSICCGLDEGREYVALDKDLLEDEVFKNTYSKRLPLPDRSSRLHENRKSAYQNQYFKDQFKLTFMLSGSKRILSEKHDYTSNLCTYQRNEDNDLIKEVREEFHRIRHKITRFDCNRISSRRGALLPLGDN